MTTEIKAKNVSIGAISGKDTNISGNLEATQNAQESALRELGDLRKLLESESGEDIEDGKELIRSAEGRPSKESISRVISWMKQIKDGANYAASTTKSFTRILSSLSSIMDKLEL